MKSNFITPFRASLQVWIKSMAADGMSPRTIARVLQLSELTGEDPGLIVERYKVLETEVKRLIYGT